MAQANPFSSLSLGSAQNLLRQGRFPEAEAQLKLLIGQGDGDACSLLGHVYLQQRRGADAEVCFRRALELGENAERLSDLAGLLPARGAVAEARQLYDRALQLMPGNAGLHCALGRLLFPAGEKLAALEELQKAVACDGGYAPAQMYLGIALLDFGRFPEARDALCLAAEKMPENPLAQYHYGVACQKTGDIVTAIAAYQAALSVRPDYLLALDRLGQCYISRNVPGQALLCYQRYLSHKPDAGLAHYGCGMALVRLGRGEDSVAEFRKAVLADYPGAKVALAGALHAAGMSGDACKLFGELCQAEPGNARAAIGYADTLQALGRLDEAFQAYLRAVTLNPDAPAYYRRLLALGEKYTLPEAQEKALLTLRDKAGQLSKDDLGELNFALYHYYAHIGKDADAIMALLAANAAKRSLAEYDEKAELGYMDATIAVTPAEVLAEKARFGNPSDLPIFIVGMPRSGTTLAEQVLSSLPDVFGAGEISDFGMELARICGQAEVADLSVLQDGDLQEVARRYVDRLKGYAPGAKRVVDKLPWNFRLVGYIHALLPGAQIIHTHRDAMDTCFSCFEQDLRSSVPFCSDLTELGHYYRAYERMMAHWREVLPEGTMLELEYESVVANFEAEARRMVAFCHLEWNPVCLDFYKSKRAVRTASAAQVRQPIYKKSVGRWKRYEAALTPLKLALGLTDTE